MDNTGTAHAATTPERSPRSGHSTQSSMSVASSSTLLDDQDEDVQIAVKALGDMRSGNIGGVAATSLSTSPISTTSMPILTTSSVPSPFTSDHDAQLEPDFVTRMAHIPLVNGALRMYEQGKASSRVVKYGAEIMESGVKTISRPVIDRLPTGQLDDFACRQLDRLDRYRRPSQGASDRQDQEEMRRASRSPTHGSQEDHNGKRTEDEVGRWVKRSASSEFPSNSLRSGNLRSSTPIRSYSREPTDAEVVPSSADRISSGSLYFPHSSPHDLGFDDHRRPPPQSQQPQSNQERQVAQRSRFQNMLLEAGGFGIAWSEESMRKLRYVLQWLQYATNHIDQQILAIRDFTESLQQHYFEASPNDSTTPTTSIHNRDSSANASGPPLPSSISAGGSRSRSTSESHISFAHMHKLTSIRRDVIHTVREVVSVVSKHGGSAALPEPARNAMKSFILQLPKKTRVRMGGGPSPDMHASTSPVGSGSNDATAVAAAASGRARSDIRRGPRGDRGVGGSSSAAPSPMSSRATSPASSPRIMPSRGSHSATSSVYGLIDDDQQISGSRNPGYTMSPGTAVVAAQRILTLATESLDMMHGVTGVVKESLERADAWIESLKTVGVQRGDGSSSTQDRSDRPSSSSSVPVSPTGRDHMNHISDPKIMQYEDRDSESDSAVLSPLSSGLNLGRSRQESFGSSTGYTFGGGSLPSTPGLTGYPSTPYGSGIFSYKGPSMDGAPTREVGIGLRSMSIRGDELHSVDVKQEEQDVEMEVDR